MLSRKVRVSTSTGRRLLTSYLENPVICNIQLARRAGPADQPARRSYSTGPPIGLGIETCSSYCDSSYTSLGVPLSSVSSMPPYVSVPSPSTVTVSPDSCFDLCTNARHNEAKDLSRLPWQSSHRRKISFVLTDAYPTIVTGSPSRRVVRTSPSSGKLDQDPRSQTRSEDTGFTAQGIRSSER
jgi:hypothetical protein